MHPASPHLKPTQPRITRDVVDVMVPQYVPSRQILQPVHDACHLLELSMCCDLHGHATTRSCWLFTLSFRHAIDTDDGRAACLHSWHAHLISPAVDEVTQNQHTLKLILRCLEGIHSFAQLARRLTVTLAPTLHITIILPRFTDACQQAMGSCTPPGRGQYTHRVHPLRVRDQSKGRDR